MVLITTVGDDSSRKIISSILPASNATNNSKFVHSYLFLKGKLFNAFEYQTWAFSLYPLLLTNYTLMDRNCEHCTFEKGKLSR